MRRVRVYGELVALFCAEDRHAEALSLEAFWNGLARTFEFKLFCGYPIKAFESGDYALAFEHVCRAHTLLRPAEGDAVASLHRVAADGPISEVWHDQRDLPSDRSEARVGPPITRLGVDRHTTDDILGRLFTRGAMDGLAHETLVRERDALLHQAPVAAAVLAGPEHRCELANPLFEALLGRCGLAGKSFREAFPELAATELPAPLDRVYISGEPFVAQAYPLAPHRGHDGQLTPGCFKLGVEPLRQRCTAYW